MKTSLKNYFLLGPGSPANIVLSENIKTVRSGFPGLTVIYSGPVTKNEFILGINRIIGKQVVPGVYVNRLYQ